MRQKEAESTAATDCCTGEQEDMLTLGRNCSSTSKANYRNKFYKDDLFGDDEFFGDDDDEDFQRRVLEEVERERKQEEDMVDYGYENAEPDIPSRFVYHRRNSLVGRIMVWAGAINDESFHQDHNNNVATRRSSMDVSRGPRRVPPARAASESLAQMARSTRPDTNDGAGKSGGYHVEDPVDATIFQKAIRRNSLQAMVEKAMSLVNIRKDDSNCDDLSPFGTRRDSLF